MEGTGVGGVVAVGTVTDILGFGGMTGDIGKPLSSISGGLVTDCTVSSRGGKLTAVAVVGNIGGYCVFGSNGVSEIYFTLIVARITVD